MELIGQRIRHLRIEERLGQGGMGEVYLARDQVLDRLVAVKTLRAEQRFSEEGKARFLREARLLSKRRARRGGEHFRPARRDGLESAAPAAARADAERPAPTVATPG